MENQQLHQDTKRLAIPAPAANLAWEDDGALLILSDIAPTGFPRPSLPAALQSPLAWRRPAPRRA